MKPISSITTLEPQWFGINFPSKFPWPQPLLILLNILLLKLSYADLICRRLTYSDELSAHLLNGC